MLHESVWAKNPNLDRSHFRRSPHGHHNGTYRRRKSLRAFRGCIPPSPHNALNRSGDDNPLSCEFFTPLTSLPIRYNQSDLMVSKAAFPAFANGSTVVRTERSEFPKDRKYRKFNRICLIIRVGTSADARTLPNYPRIHYGIENGLTTNDFNVKGAGLKRYVGK
jgi:hypothetical protein